MNHLNGLRNCPSRWSENIKQPFTKDGEGLKRRRLDIRQGHCYDMPYDHFCQSYAL